MSQQEVVNLAKYMDQPIRVKFQGGREIQGILKGSLLCVQFNFFVVYNSIFIAL